ncbi:MAG: ABC transporter permease, partial [Acidobacteriaceae bacterium]
MLNLLFHTQMSLGLGQAAAVAVLAILVAQFASRRGAKIGREIPLVLLRGIVQILLVGFLIVVLLRGPWWTGIPV